MIRQIRQVAVGDFDGFGAARGSGSKDTVGAIVRAHFGEGGGRRTCAGGDDQQLIRANDLCDACFAQLY